MKEQVFHKVADFLLVDEQDFQRVLPDLIRWQRLSRKALYTLKKMGAVEDTGSVQADFVWTDDGNNNVPSDYATVKEIRDEIYNCLNQIKEIEGKISRLKVEEMLLNCNYRIGNIVEKRTPRSGRLLNTYLVTRIDCSYGEYPFLSIKGKKRKTNGEWGENDCFHIDNYPNSIDGRYYQLSVVGHES